jgi:hypothetical protein
MVAQSRHLLNSSHIQNKIETGSNFKKLFSQKKPPREIADELYLTVFSRYPTDQEVKTVMAYGDLSKTPAPVNDKTDKTETNENKKTKGKTNNNSKPRNGEITPERSKWNDIAWSLINSPEFLYKH